MWKHNRIQNITDAPTFTSRNIDLYIRDGISLAKITIFYCYFKTILLLSHLFLSYFIWKKPLF